LHAVRTPGPEYNHESAAGISKPYSRHESVRKRRVPTGIHAPRVVSKHDYSWGEDVSNEVASPSGADAGARREGVSVLGRIRIPALCGLDTISWPI
jgi:hypothetical protein